MITLKFLLNIVTKAKDKGIRKEIENQKKQLIQIRQKLMAEHLFLQDKFTTMVYFHRTEYEKFDMNLRIEPLTSTMHLFFADNEKVKNMMNKIKDEIYEVDSWLDNLT